MIKVGEQFFLLSYERSLLFGTSHVTSITANKNRSEMAAALHSIEEFSDSGESASNQQDLNST